MKVIIERQDGTRRVQTVFPEDDPLAQSRTSQEFYKDSDINEMMKKYQKTGILGNPLDYRQGQYGDFSSGDDYFETLCKVKDVQRIFDELPSQVRNKFNNNPKELIDFLVEEDNNEEAYRLGLKTRPPVKAEPVEAPTAPSGATPAGAPAGTPTP